jgi:hypothetical protein
MLTMPPRARAQPLRSLRSSYQNARKEVGRARSERRSRGTFGFQRKKKRSAGLWGARCPLS